MAAADYATIEKVWSRNEDEHAFNTEGDPSLTLLLPTRLYPRDHAHHYRTWTTNHGTLLRVSYGHVLIGMGSVNLQEAILISLQLIGSIHHISFTNKLLSLQTISNRIYESFCVYPFSGSLTTPLRNWISKEGQGFSINKGTFRFTVPIELHPFKSPWQRTLGPSPHLANCGTLNSPCRT